MANPQFSSDIDFPITVKPLTSPLERQTHQDLFNIFNSFRILTGALDTEFQEIHDELATKISDAPEDGKTYGRKDGAWAEVTGGGGGSNIVAQQIVATATNTVDVVGLDLDTAGTYRVVVHALYAAGAANWTEMQYNADTANNYKRQWSIFTTAASAGRDTARTLIAGYTPTVAAEQLIDVVMTKNVGKQTMHRSTGVCYDTANNTTTYNSSCVYVATTNITSLRFFTTSLFQPGTSFTVYKA